MVSAPCAVAGDGDCLYTFFTYFEKKKSPKILVMTTLALLVINMFSPTSVPNLMTLT